MKWVSAILFLIAGMMAGCGEGGGVADVPTPTLGVATRAPLATTVLYGVQLTVQLPPGVTIAADASGAVANGVVTPAIAGTTVGAHYYAAGTNSPATLLIVATNPNGFTVGNLLSVACKAAAGVSPTAGSFSVTDFSAWSVRGSDIMTIDGITAELSYAVI